MRKKTSCASFCNVTILNFAAKVLNDQTPVLLYEDSKACIAVALDQKHQTRVCIELQFANHDRKAGLETRAGCVHRLRSGTCFASPEQFGHDYWTKTVTSDGLAVPPTDTTIAAVPGGIFCGITTLICIMPATSPCAPPAY